MKFLTILISAFFVFSSVVRAEDASTQTTTAPAVNAAPAVQNQAPTVPVLPKVQAPKKKRVKNNAAVLPEGVTPEDVISKINEGNKAMQKLKEKSDYCEICELNKKTETTAHTEIPAREAKAIKDNPDALTEPKGDENSINTRVAVCKTQPGIYDLCTYNGDVVPGQIRFADRTGALRREWQFDFAGQARQDLGFSISDANDEHVSQSKETYMMVFPRRYLPSIRIEGDQQVVTLATGEKVTFDAKTKRIVGGALTNEKSYTGTGVAIRVDSTGEEPRLGNRSVTITKNGKPCKSKVVPRNLWPDQADNSMLHFKYPSDAEFDKFLQKTCGFSMY
ncbi:hypothetical protein [Bdellovibrio sp. HCB337]|uniref:hypothetical protein n=1 Tax=Bdellovibrio sp. HCB337 TaxID=3394358 RepID=UPI0039A64377